MTTIETRLTAVESALQMAGIATKEVLTFDEASQFSGLSKSYLYKLTSRGVIPHYKPAGKLLFFNREELQKWLLSNRVTSDSEISERAQSYCLKKGGVK
ncbi:MAG: helix-turn-helix domain-containing protein [Bacilli bacterium]|jgi:excisionase family DNA binding protein|nr:helix-turn-helix domain-containing protein [Bacilli bacterium]